MHKWILYIGLLALCASASNLKQMEYFWDNDPGTGSGITLIAIDGSYDQALEIALANPANAPSDPGAHTLNVRAMNEQNVWGPVSNVSVYFRNMSELANLPIGIQAMEYFCDSDPGTGLATAFASLTKLDMNRTEAQVTIPSSIVTRGPHSCGVRAKNKSGAWSPTKTFSFFGSIDGPPLAPIISGDSSACTNGTLHSAATASYSVAAEYGATYTWTVTGGTFVGTPSTTATVNWDLNASVHKLEVYGTNTYFPNQPGPSSTLDVTITSLPTITITKDGNDLRTTEDPNWTYQWTKNGTNIPNTNDYRYWATEDGSYRVFVSSYCGTTNSSSVMVTYDANQPQPGTQPVITPITPSVAENEKGASIATLQATGTGGYPVIWSVTGASADRYQINSTTGALALKSGESYDFESSTSDVVHIALSIPATNATASYDLTVTVTNVNEAPIVAAMTFDIDENQAPTTLGTLSAVDPDNDPLTWNIIAGNDEQLFTLNEDGSFSVNESLDFEVQGSYILNVQVSDSKLSASTTLTVKVGDVAELSSSSSDRVSSSSSLEETISSSSEAVHVSSSSTGNVKTSSSSATSNIIAQQHMKLHAQERQVQIHLSKEGEFKMEIFNLQGKPIYSINQLGKAGDSIWQIPSQVKPGIWILRIQQGPLSKSQRIIIKQ